MERTPPTSLRVGPRTPSVTLRRNPTSSSRGARRKERATKRSRRLGSGGPRGRALMWARGAGTGFARRHWSTGRWNRVAPCSPRAARTLPTESCDSRVTSPRLRPTSAPDPAPLTRRLTRPPATGCNPVRDGNFAKPTRRMAHQSPAAFADQYASGISAPPDRRNAKSGFRRERNTVGGIRGVRGSARRRSTRCKE